MFVLQAFCLACVFHRIAKNENYYSRSKGTLRGVSESKYEGY